MAVKTLPTLNPTSTIADDSILLVRRSGQTSDEYITAVNLQTYIGTGLDLTGGAVENTPIGASTPAAATFTEVNTPEVQATGAEGVVLKNSGGTTVATIGASNGTVSTFAGAVSAASLSLTADLPVAEGGTGASTAAGARTNLGLGTIATEAAADYLSKAGNLSGLADASAARTNLGLGTIATQAANNVTITGGSISGITDLAVADGGTGASTAANARTNLGLTIGTDVQAYDAGLQSIAGLTTLADRMIYTTALDTYAVTTLTSFARTLLDDTNSSAARTTLGLGTIATQAANNVTITGGSISGITDLAVADGGTGASTAANARTNLGLGTIATQAASNVTITGGSITGISDLAIADGGTGASTASAARTNLGLVIGTDVQAYNANLTTWAGKTAPTGAVVGTTDSQTLTDKTLTAPVINAGTVSSITAFSTSTTAGANMADSGAATNALFTSASNASFTGNVIRINTARAASSAYDAIETTASDGGDVTFRARGDGVITADGSFTGGGADYAECMEWSDGNPGGIDGIKQEVGSNRVGYSVVLENNKIRLAEDGETPIGITSLRYNTLGNDEPMAWNGKWLKDAFGVYAMEDGKRKINSEYDASLQYTKRSERKEWHPVGLVGFIPLRRGQPVAPTWRKQADLDENTELWFLGG